MDKNTSKDKLKKFGFEFVTGETEQEIISCLRKVDGSTFDKKEDPIQSNEAKTDKTTATNKVTVPLIKLPLPPSGSEIILQ